MMETMSVDVIGIMVIVVIWEHITRIVLNVCASMCHLWPTNANLHADTKIG